MQNKYQRQSWLHWLLPTPGNVIFTLLVITGLFYVQNVGAVPLPFNTGTDATTTTIPYQGYLTDSDNNPISGPQTMAFSLYNQATGSTFLWTEQHTGVNSVQIDNGLFNVMLGSIAALDQVVITDNDRLYLGIKVGTNSEIFPRIELGRVPYAVQADQATTVSNGSITNGKLADGAVTQDKLSSEFDFAMIQSGWMKGNQERPGWTLHQGSGIREYMVPITFDRSFGYTPTVMVALSMADTDTSAPNRIAVWAQDSTPTGFNLAFSTWGDSIVNDVNATWIAYTSP